MLRRTRQFLFLMLIAGAVHAAELGDPRVSSHIGQQLVADIELTLLEDTNTPVQVRLASPEVYNGAGIAVPPVLSSLNLAVMRRDGRQFLHATTLRPVEADHLHLYLELVDHGQRVVRLATLWLTPDPNPAPAALPTPAPVVAAPAPAHVPAPTPAPARVHAEPPAAKTAPQPAPPAPKLLPLPVHAAARPAACAPQSGEAEACVALGAKNAELRARIGQLEQRVKGLQASLGAGKPAAPKPVAPQLEAPKPEALTPAAQKPEIPAPVQEARPPKHPAGPAPISSIKPLVPHKPKAPPPADDGLPWGMIAGGLAVLAALGGAAALVRVRGKRSRNVDIPADPGMLPRLRERFFARNGVKGEADPVAGRETEPSLE
jgi:hypothetical protein